MTDPRLRQLMGPLKRHVWNNFGDQENQLTIHTAGTPNGTQGDRSVAEAGGFGQDKDEIAASSTARSRA